MSETDDGVEVQMPCRTCSGPVREIVGMVCQTCLTDYSQPGDHGRHVNADDIEWRNPPSKSRRVDRIKETLITRPGQWALIVKAEGFVLFPWWGPLDDDPRFEMRRVSDRPFGPVDTYARFIRSADDAPLGADS